MKKGLLILLFLVYQAVAFSQAKEKEMAFEKVEITAEPNPKEWDTYIRKKTKLPDSVQQSIPEGNYNATVQFIVDIHGNIGQAKLKTDPGYGLGERAVEIIRNYPGAWRPASQCGRLVKSYRTLVVNFAVKKMPEAAN